MCPGAGARLWTGAHGQPSARASGAALGEATSVLVPPSLLFGASVDFQGGEGGTSVGLG